MLPEKPWQCTKRIRASITTTRALPPSPRTPCPCSATKPWQDLTAKLMPSKISITWVSIHFLEQTTLNPRWMCRSFLNNLRTPQAKLSCLESKIRSARNSSVSFSMLITQVEVVILFKEEVEKIQKLTITPSLMHQLNSNSSSCFSNSRDFTTCQSEVFPIQTRSETSRVTTSRCHQSQRMH